MLGRLKVANERPNIIRSEADRYRDNTEYYLKKAEKYQRDATYYTILKKPSI